MAVKKMFIAGASCPACGAIDKVQRWEDPLTQEFSLHCVACGHHEILRQEKEDVKAVDAAGKIQLVNVDKD